MPRSKRDRPVDVRPAAMVKRYSPGPRRLDVARREAFLEELKLCRNVRFAAASAGTAYLAISLWVIRDVAVRSAHLAEVPVADLLGTQRHYGGAVLTLISAGATLVGAVLLMRSAARARPDTARYARRTAPQADDAGAAMSERSIWDALDEGRDPTRGDNKGR